MPGLEDRVKQLIFNAKTVNRNLYFREDNPSFKPDYPVPSLLKSDKFHPPEENLRPFRLNLDLPFDRPDIERLVDYHTIQYGGQTITPGNTFEGIPFTSWFFYILITPETQGIFPGRIASIPVDPATLNGHGLTIRMIDRRRSVHGISHQTGNGIFGALIANHQKVAGTSFNDLTFDAVHPDTMMIAI
jgi:hypothetical protein